MTHLASARVGILIIATGLLLSACTTNRDTQPNRTATEELLISSAVDRAVTELHPVMASGTHVFVDAQYFDGLDAKYTIAAVRAQLLREGAVLADDRKTAQAILEIRNGAQSIDQHVFLVGIPSFNVPIPLAGSFTFPEVALYKSAREAGVSKIALVIYDAKTGKLDSDVPPQYGLSQETDHTVMIFFTWHEDNLMPGGALGTELK